MSDTRRDKALGNAVTVNAIKAIADKIKELERKIELYDDAWRANSNWVIYQEKRMLELERRIEALEPLTTKYPQLKKSPVVGVDESAMLRPLSSKPSPAVEVKPSDMITISRKVADQWLITMHDRMQTQDMDKHDQEMVFELRKALYVCHCSGHDLDEDGFCEHDKRS
jgi:hypothetical protein